MEIARLLGWPTWIGVVDDIERGRAELIRRGVESISDVFPNDEAPWTYFRDPEGNVFALKQERRAP